MSDATTWIKKANESERERYKEFVQIAYMLAGWFRCELKRFPKLEDVLSDIDKAGEPKKEQTPLDMFEVVKRLNARLGGD